MKHNWKPGNMIYPLPAVLVSCGSELSEYNVLTVAWVGTLCTNPPMCYISVRPERYSYPIIQKNMEFVINLTTKDMAPGKAKVVKAPIIEESPVSIECRVKEIIPLGSHHMFIAEVMNVQADDCYLDKDSGKFELANADPLVYLHGGYFELGEKIGKFGWSVEKKRKKK